MEIFSKNRFPPAKENMPYFFTLGPHSFQWFILEKPRQQPVKKEELPGLRVQAWDKFFENGNVKEALEMIFCPHISPKQIGSQEKIVSFILVQSLSVSASCLVIAWLFCYS